MLIRRLALSGLALGLLFVLTASPLSVARAAGIVVNVFGDGLDSFGCAATGTGTCTLRDAVTFANASSGADTITFSFDGTISLASPLPDITSSMSVDGTNKTITIDGGGTTTLLSVKNAATLNLTNLTLSNGYCDTNLYGGGAITNNNSTVNATGIRFVNNTASANCVGGGAITSVIGTLNITNSTFSGNTAQLSGGAISYSGILNVTSSQFSNNQVLDDNSGDGGAIANDSYGAGNITSSTFTDNNAFAGGAIANSDKSDLIVTRSIFTDNTATQGDAIYVTDGTVTLKKSTFSGNFANYGGVIYQVGGYAQVQSSTLVNNQGSEGGGAIYLYAPGGGTTLALVNSTLTQNSAKPFGNGGALYNWGGTAHITNATIYGNEAAALVDYAGGIYNYFNTTKLHNTIVANNSGYDCWNDEGNLEANAYNLADDDSCNAAKQVTVAQLALGPLQNNGGRTQTMALGAGSAALDAGNDARCSDTIGSSFYGAGSLDQRDLTRPQGLHCDVGAYESNTQFGPGFVVNVSDDSDDGACAAWVANFSDCTLREAINAAHVRGGSDTITFNFAYLTAACTDTNACVITLTSHLPDIDSKIKIDAMPNNAIVTIVGAAGEPILGVNSGSKLTLNALTFINGNCGCAFGGGILNYGTLNVTNSTFTADAAVTSEGSAISNFGTATVTNSTISGGTQFGYGGILNGEDATLTIVNSTIAANDGYGIALEGGTILLRNTIVANNQGSDCDLTGSATLTADSHNIDSDGTCGDATQKTVDEIALNPMQDRKGPTATMKPGSTSSALDAGDNAVCAADVGAPNYGAGGLDQRGIIRPQGPACDVGAYEVRK